MEYKDSSKNIWHGDQVQIQHEGEWIRHDHDADYQNLEYGQPFSGEFISLISIDEKL